MLARHVPAALGALVGICATAPPAGAQYRDSLRVGIVTHATPAVSEDDPDGIEIMEVSTLTALIGSATGAVMGFVVDAKYCDRHYGSGEEDWFPPCLLYTGAGTDAGWVLGSVVGAAVGAATEGQARGCPRGRATLRALAGAVVGAATPTLLAIGRWRRHEPAGTPIILLTPVMSSAGATVAMLGCHR